MEDTFATLPLTPQLEDVMIEGYRLQASDALDYLSDD